MGLRLHFNQAAVISIFFLMSVHLLTTNPTQAPGILFTPLTKPRASGFTPNLEPTMEFEGLWSQIEWGEIDINDTIDLQALRIVESLWAPTEFLVTLKSMRGIIFICENLKTTSKVEFKAQDNNFKGFFRFFFLGERRGEWVVWETDSEMACQLTLTVPWEGKWILLFMNLSSTPINLYVKVKIIEEQLISSWLSTLLYLCLFTLIAGLGVKFISIPIRYDFQFQIRPPSIPPFPYSDSDQWRVYYAFNKVQNALKAQSKRNRIKEETPPQAFAYQTYWGKGTIQLASEEPQIMVTGIVQRGWSALNWLIIFIYLVILYGLYGLLGVVITLPLLLLSYLLFDIIIGYKSRKTLGSQLCSASDGAQFQQTALKFSFKRLQWVRI